MTVAELQVLALSLRVATVGTLIALPIAMAAAWFLARSRSRARLVVDIVSTLPLVLPPIVSGYALLVLFSQSSPLGTLLARVFGVEIVFTWVAASLAGGLVALPLMIRAMEIALAGVDRRLEQAARTLGAGAVRAFVSVTLPLASRGLVGGIVLGFLRAFAEFGATIVVAGNIPGHTQTVPLAIFTLLETGNDEAAVQLILLSVGIAVVALTGHTLLLARRTT